MKGTFCAMLMLPKVTERNRIFATILWVLITGRELLITTVVADRSHCDCMDYWECIGSGGTPYAYCSYSSQVCCFVEPSAVSVGILPRRKKSGSCGIKGPNKGRDGVTDPGEWAWHAAVLETPQDLYICGASLLDEYWILTAAHCVYEYSLPNALKIRLGEYDVSTTSEPLKYEEYTASRIVVHPNFDNRTLLHDIALVRLTRPAKRKANINVVCMPPEGTTNNELVSSARCFVTGWGKSTENGEHSVVLKEVNVPLWRNDDCERSLKFHFGPNYRLPATSLCAGAEGRDACDGDGGGPLVCEKEGRWYQVGIVSFGIGCGQPNTPGIYTRVESYSNWIHRVVASDNKNDNSSFGVRST
ncbi:tryptase-like isoform X2 [Stegodyphus dumicola]|uniref:tryptase-like isoform X2 n=1 Tax=Stegodyphus dumicola TaxID=202533 RepID=UPI0015A9766B|nr:tryptase-like isoform X2 [Stegodyphus dumicola]